MKERMDVYFLLIKNYLLYGWLRFNLFFQNLYFRFKIDQLYYFIKYLFHHYDSRQFSVLCFKKNLTLLQRVRKDKQIWLDAKSNGELIEFSSRLQKYLYILKDLVLLGAPHSRLFKVIKLTLTVLCIEVYNPLDKKILKKFIPRKIAYYNRLKEGLKKMNGSPFSIEGADFQLRIFEGASYLQMKITKEMRKACLKTRKPEVIKLAEEGLAKGLFPLLVTVGLSGSYWMRGPDRQILGLFKPYDEEINAPNNPMGPAIQGGLGQRNARSGIRVGEGAHREVAAYLIDQFFGFGIVPRTFYASFTHQIFTYAHENPNIGIRSMKTKYGSFQEYVEGFKPLHHLDEKETQSISLEEYQLLLLLDIILGNSDRNANNVLYNEGKLAAIDHALCFPDVHETLTSWYLKSLSQGKEPLYSSIKQILSHFPYEGLSSLLKRKCLISNNCLERMRERIALFNAGIERGYTPFDLHDLMQIEYLNPLAYHDLTLKEAAEKSLELYLKAPKKGFIKSYFS